MTLLRKKIDNRTYSAAVEYEGNVIRLSEQDSLMFAKALLEDNPPNEKRLSAAKHYMQRVTSSGAHDWWLSSTSSFNLSLSACLLKKSSKKKDNGYD